jgi:hypothetical protein
MKKICLITLLVLSLQVTSSFAVPITMTGQQIIIPYAVLGSGWWSGVAINNASNSQMLFSFGVYKDNGQWVDGIQFAVAGHAMKVDLLENFFGGTPPSGRMSLVIQTHTNVPFQATLFVGNDEGGFGFQNYTSSDYTWTYDIGTPPL